MKITPQIGIVLVEAAKVALKIEFSLKCGHKTLRILQLDVCGGGTS